jgi:hypothetical protein
MRSLEFDRSVNKNGFKDLPAAVRLSINEAELFAKRFKSSIGHNQIVHRHVDITQRAAEPDALSARALHLIAGHDQYIQVAIPSRITPNVRPK